VSGRTAGLMAETSATTPRLGDDVMVHDPYHPSAAPPSTPPRAHSPPACMFSPDPRTPTRTRKAIQRLSLLMNDSGEAHDAIVPIIPKWARPHTAPVISSDPRAPGILRNVPSKPRESSSPTAVPMWPRPNNFADGYQLPKASGRLLSALPSPEGSPGPSSPASTPNLSPGKSVRVFVMVGFKCGRTLQCQTSLALGFEPGQYLIVEGDEGEDLGRATTVWTPPVSGLVTSRDSSRQKEQSYPAVLRRATPAEVHRRLGLQAAAEARCLDWARHKAQEHGLRMAVVDAEFQFDGRKLTLHYTADGRVDFRELVRELYKQYRVRIWMSLVPIDIARDGHRA